MKYDEAKLYLEHTSYDDFNLEEHQINNRLEAIKIVLEENAELKKQTEEYIDGYFSLSKENIEYVNKLHKYKKQQKEFVNYLEDYLKMCNKDIQNFSKDFNVYFSLITDLKTSRRTIQEILSKYKEIIGDVEDDKSN